MCVDFIHETSAKAFQELNVCIMGGYAEIYIILLWGDIAFDDCLDIVVIIRMGVDVYLLVVLVPFHVGE